MTVPTIPCLTATVAVAFLAACGGDPTGTNSGDALSEVEIQALFDQLTQAYATAGVGVPALSRGGGEYVVSADPVPLDATFDVTAPCQAGNIAVSGSVDGEIDDTTLEGAFTVELAWEPDGCQVTAGAVTFTVDGAPRIQLTVDFAITQTAWTISGTQTGGFSFTTDDGRSGSCAIDLAFDSSVNTSTNAVSVTASGTVCGVSAAGFQPFGVT